MKPGRGDSTEEMAEIHCAARSPSPHAAHLGSHARGDSASRRLSNGHAEEEDNGGPSGDRARPRDTWFSSEQNGSLDAELPIHDQIKQGILGFVENEIKKSDSTKPPSYVFYSHDPSGSEDRLTIKSLSRPSSGHREKRSPSYRKKKRHMSRRERDLNSEFEIPGSSLSALEKVDDYLKEYNKEEVVTLSGDLEIEVNDMENNNESVKEARYKQRKTRRKTRDDRADRNANGCDVSPRVHAKAKHGNKSVRPTELPSVLDSLEPALHLERYVDNPFSSPSPVTTPSDVRGAGAAGRSRPSRVYLQGGGTFRAVNRDALADSQRNTDEQKYLRLGDLTPLDVALAVQRAWRSVAPACHGLLAGLALMHLLLISCTDGLDAGHLSFHAVVTMPYVTTYYLLCVLSLLSVLDRLDASSVDLSVGLQPYCQPAVLVILYSACLLVCTAARSHDERMQLQYTSLVDNATFYNVTTPTIPTFYNTWTHLSIWRAVLSLLGLAYLLVTDPPDLVYNNLGKLLQFKQSLQSIG